MTGLQLIRSATIEIFARLQPLESVKASLESSATIEIFARLQHPLQYSELHHSSATIEIFARLQRIMYNRRINCMFCYHRNFC